MSSAAATGGVTAGPFSTTRARLLPAIGAALPIGLGLASAAGAVLLLLQPAAWTALVAPVGAALAIVAWMRPVLAVALLLAVAPVCGNRPTTGPFLAFIAWTACAVPGWLVRLATRDRATALDLLGTPVGLAMAGYAGASMLSLSSLPLYAPADIVGAASITEALRLLPVALAAADVRAPIYPPLTVVLTLHAVVAALTVAVAARGKAGDRPAAAADAPTLVTAGILTGLVLAIAAAALDRLGLLDLRVLRATDPFTNASGAERLQSTFGHAGWFAQFVCFAMPAILAAWLWPAESRVRPGDPPVSGGREPRGTRIARMAAAVTLLGLALVVLVLSHQRGGWITGAIVGAGVTAAIVRLASATPVRPRRLAVVAAAALVASLGAGLLVLRAAGGPAAMDRFTARVHTLTQVSDRRAHVTAGVRLGSLLPILGGGSESFAMRYQQEYLRAGGAFYARGESPLLDMYGSAHNVFVQTFAGKGLVGLLALVLLVVAASAAARRTLRRPDTPPRPRVVAMITVGMIAAFVIYGQVQEVFYIPPLQLMVFVAFALALAMEPPIGSAHGACRRLGVVAVLLAIGLTAHLVHGYGVPGRLASDYRDRMISRAGERLSAPIRGDDGEYFQWTGRRAVVTVPRQATELSFELRRAGPEPGDVEVRFDGRLVDRIRLEDDAWRRVVYPLQRMRTLPQRLEIAVVTTPAGPGDAPDRGAALRRIRWGMD